MSQGLLFPRDRSGYTAGMMETHKRHWFRLTPDRLLFALLPIWECCFLCEHFRWLDKGYPLLLAVACVVGVLLFLLLWFIVALVFRWRFQFSLARCCL